MKKFIQNFSKKVNTKNKKYIIIFLLILSTFIIFHFSLFIITPDINQIPFSTTIYDSNNIKIWEIITDNKYRHEKLKFEEIPDFTKKSIINLEDKTFYQNNWIDYLALIRAIKNNISNTQILEWASTISSQVIRNNYW